LNGGAKVNRERLIQEILSSIEASGFPNQLSLKNQGIFAIGYYHQRKDFFTAKPKPEEATATA
jgi:CRISPR-associated protein Csd1